VISANSTISSTSTVFANTTSTITSGSTFVVGPTAPIGVGPSGVISLSTASGAPYGNGTSSTVSTGPTAPIGTGVSSVAPINSTSDISSSSTLTVPIGTGVSSGISSSATSGAPYGNGTTSALPVGPTGTGVTTSTITSKTVIVSPIGTGASSGISSSTAISAPYGNGTTNALPVGPTGTGLSTSAIIIGNITTTSAALNSTISLTTSYNLTSSIQSTVITMSANSTVSAPLTTAPIVTGPSTSLSTSSGKYTNTTSSASTTPTYAFSNWGGITSGHPVATNTTACSVKPTSTATCVRCEGQPGTDKYCGLTINDDSYAVVPKTCNQVEFSMDLTECEVAPDGISRKALCVNGQFPGPLLEASWGDEVIIHVTNSMTRNGTSVHWHGIRQNHTNEMDGVVGLTQCALAPGQSMTYKWTAESYGFSWYHSHLTLQAYEGLFGPMYIHGPKSADFDVDAGHLIINDWSHIPVDDMYNDAQVAGVRTMDTGLINGMNINPVAKDGAPAGQRYTVPTEFVPGKKYLFQLLNSAIQSTYKFYIDGHKFTVIAADFVPIEPYETTVLSINIGQRYEIIVEADQEVGDYFLRFDNQNACATTTNSDDIRGIIHYAGSSGGTPTSTAHTYPRKDNGVGGILGTCEDEPLASLVPILKKTVSSPHQTVQHDVAVSNSNGINLYRWYLDGTTFQSNWGDATLYSIINNDTIPDYSGDLAISTSLGEWVYVIIESPVPLGHPIHLHGHDFYVLAAGYGNYGSGTTLNLDNPPRRDVAFMPGDGPTGQGGHLVIAFFTDNPGVWLMHCHIGWHVAMGFALQFISGQEQIKDTVTDTCLVNDVCNNWRPWAQEKGIYTDDSGV
jgi:FtsP/CotA-like multicopper oxidase with cupredoxin domain